MITLGKKNILITGASSGIGRACSILFSSLGANLLLLGRDINELNKTIAALKFPDKAYSSLIDLNEFERFEIIIAEFVLKHGPIDGFVHSAGNQITLPLRMHSKEIFDNLMNVNAIAAFEITKIITKRSYFNSEGGSIVYIASIRASAGIANQIGYSASKGALIAGTKSLAIELAQRKIRVNSVSPGMVEGTKMTKNVLKKMPQDWETNNKAEYPLGWVSPEAIAYACAFLLSETSSFITGIDLLVDGGFSAK